MRTFLVRALSFSAITAFTLNPALTPVIAADYRPGAAPVAPARPSASPSVSWHPAIARISW